MERDERLDDTAMATSSKNQQLTAVSLALLVTAAAYHRGNVAGPVGLGDTHPAVRYRENSSLGRRNVESVQSLYEWGQIYFTYLNGDRKINPSP